MASAPIYSGAKSVTAARTAAALPVFSAARPIAWAQEPPLTAAATPARNTRAFARDIGLAPRTTPVSSPQSNGMTEACARIT